MRLALARLSANIAFLFAERPFLDRIAAAKAAGFSWVECHFPYDHSVAEIKGALDRAGVRMNSLNTAAGGEGEFGRAGLPGREAAFERDFAQAVAYASALGVPMIHVMAGVTAPALWREAIRTYVANLRAAADTAPDLTLLLEPLNSRDRPSYLVSQADELAEIIAEIGKPNVKLLFDVYHVQIMAGDLLKRLERLMPLIGHIQIAGVPDRSEPDVGEVNYHAVIEALDGLGYDGLVGLEYRPRAGTEAGLRWLDAFGLRQ